MVQFDADDIRILRQTIRRVREGLPFGGTPISRPPSELTEISWVKLTSTTATAGRYPGTRFDHDTQNTGMDTASETVWMEAPNGEAVDTSTYYPCRFSGILATDGLAVFVMIAGTAAGNRLGWAPVRVYTTSLPTYTRTSNTITASANGALAAQDGVTLVVGERLLHNRSSGHADNGIWTVTTVGTAGTPYVLDRATDADADADFKSGYLVSVSEGTSFKDTVWMLTTNDPITLNTTALVFATVGPYVTGTSGTDFAISGNVINLPDASITNRGVVTIGAQTFLGLKRFEEAVSCQMIGNPANKTYMQIDNVSGRFATENAGRFFGLILDINMIFIPAPSPSLILTADGGDTPAYAIEHGGFLYRGATGSFTTTDGKTVIVKGGITTNIL
jgi:hypothetical protein